MTRNVFCIILVSIIFYFIMTTGSSCANIVPPVGGDKDSIAPKLLKAIPNNNSLQVKSKTITFDFDEYVELEDASKNIIISPLPNVFPEISRRLRTVTIKLKDSLETNTTYTIEVNGAIKDVNEGNKLKDFVYTFTTGNSMDSASLKGNVTLAETGKIDSNLLVVLYTKLNDSAVVKDRPKYVAKLNGEGNFFFKNLPSKEFNIFVITDEGAQKKYSSPRQLFGFKNESINTGTNKAPINLVAFIQEKEIPKPANDKYNPTEKIKFGTSLSGGQQDILKDLIITSNKKLSNLDTSKIKLTDTLFKNNFITKIILDSNKKQFTIKANWALDKVYKLILPKEFATDEKGVALAKSDTIKVTALSEKEYGKVTLRFSNIELNKHLVLQIIQNEKIVVAYPLTSLKLTIPLMLPGDYDLRILKDDNKNGIWDPGSFFTNKKQPETVKVLKQKLTVKADWDNELEIDE
jgi:Bacterial Ig-like domain